MEITKKITPMKAMRLKCLDCMCGNSHEVDLCSVRKCPLHLYRFGKRPETARRKGKDV